MSLSQQLQQLLADKVGLIDLRTIEVFAASHIKGSCSLPWDRLAESMYELPANHQPVAIIGNAAQCLAAEQFLSLKGYRVLASFQDSEVFWQQARKLNLLESGNHSVALWQANPLLIEIIDQVEQHTSGRSVIDLACGAGRDSVYLAKRGWQVTAIDHKADALERCQRLATASQTKLTTLLRDLENQPEPLADLSADLVLIMRYLHRPLFAAIDQLIKPGGAIVYSTFMVGSEQYGSPKNPAYLLKPGELARVFSNYHILIDQQRALADGRPVALFVAIKK